MKRVVLILLFILCQQVQAEILVSVDRDPVVVDESFQLIFESDKNVDGQPDFDPLNKSFTVLNSSTRSSTQIINGKVSHSQQWILTVIANKTGLLDIPPINFGKEMSQPRSIKVVASAPASKNSINGDVYIDVEVDTSTPYVQAQVIYTVKLYWAVPMSNANLSEPKVSGGQAVIDKLGDDKSYETRRNGKRYGVNERRYVIFPQSSGHLKIEPLLFQGQTGNGGFFNFDPFGPQAQSIVKRSEQVELDVKPIPDSFTGKTWLPARQINLQEQWSVAPDKLKQGEAATRTLSLNAVGLAASQLPAINDAIPDEFKQYPDQPEFEESNNANGSLGVRREKMAIIPTQAGDYIMPAIKVPWWNTTTDKMEVAELPERKIHVKATANAVTSNNTVNENKSVKDASIPSPDKGKDGTVEAVAKAQESSFWKWVSLALFILWLLTLMLWWLTKSRTTYTAQVKEHALPNRFYLKQIEAACKQNDPSMTKKALLEWAKSMWPEEKISSISQIKNHCGQDLQNSLDDLNNSLYGKNTSQWNGADFLSKFKAQSFNAERENKQVGKLEPLYKT